MQVKALLKRDDAVSPVIGVILMVAITVILAAVIGTFTLGLGDYTGTAQPTTDFDFDYTEGGASGCSALEDGSTTGDLEVEHNGGDTIKAGRLTLRDDDGSSVDWTTCGSVGAESDVDSGDSVTAQVGSDDRVTVVWTAKTDGDSAPIGEWLGPDG